MNFVFVHCLCFYHGKSRETISQQKGTLCSTMKIFLFRYYTFISKNCLIDTGECRGIQENTGDYGRIQGNAGEYRRTPGTTGEYRRIQENTREYRGIQENTREYRRTQENTREYRRIEGNRREYKRIQGNTRECIRKCNFNTKHLKKGQITLNTKPHPDPL